VPFAVHSTDGQPLSLRAAGQTRHGVAFAPADPDLHGLVLLDLAGFDAWYEEDEPVVGHVRDLFHRLEILASSLTVRIELDGIVLAQSTRAQLLFEHAILPVRSYVPPEDIRVALQPSPPERAARTRAKPPTGRSTSTATPSTTSPGATRPRCQKPPPSQASSASSTNAST